MSQEAAVLSQEADVSVIEHRHIPRLEEAVRRLRSELAETEKRLSTENPNLVILNHPVQFGKELIEQIELKPNCKSFRDYELPMEMVENGGRNRVLFRPYELARVGLHMAGRPQAILDKMHPQDMWEVANRVMGFIGVAPTTGSDGSPS